MIKRRRHALDAVFIVLGAIAFLAAPMRAQEEPIIIGEREELPRFHMDPLDVSLELRTYYSADRSRSPQGTTRFRQYRFDEVLDLATRGYVVHPNLMDYRISLGVGLSQTSSHANRRVARENELLTEFDTSATFLREQTVPITLYAQRNRSIISRPFGPSLENVQTTYGGRTSISLDNSTHNFDLSTTRVRQDGITGQDEFEYTQDRFLWSSNFRIGANQTVTWDYQFTRTEQDRQGFGAQFDTHDLHLNHVLTFGQSRQHSLTSTLRYLDQSGDLNLQSFRWDEHLLLRHSDRFETRYRYSYTDRRVGGVEHTQHRGTAGFRHRLYESLTTTGTIGLQESRTNDARTFESFGDITLDYRKKVPYGRFTSRMSLGHSRLDSASRQAPAPVVNAPHSFANALPIVLLGPEVMPETLVLKDPTGLLVYTPGIDYLVTPFDDRVEISRIVGGRLDAGDPVLIDYFLAPRPRHVQYTGNFALSGRYDLQQGPLQGLGFYSRYARQDQRIETAAPGLFVPNDFTDYLVGIDYRTPNLTLSLERQWRDAEILPFEATRLTARYQHRLGIDTRLRLNSSYAIIDYTDIDNRVNLFTASAQVHHDFTSRLRGIATVAFRDERNRQFGTTTGFEQQAELQWRYRQTELFLSVRNANLRRADTRQDFQLLFAGLRREF